MAFTAQDIIKGPREIYRLSADQSDASFDIIRPYATEICLAGTATITLGRFSVGILPLIQILSDKTGATFNAGSFCMASKACIFIVGGNHKNEAIVNFNYTLIGLPFSLFGTDEDKAAFEAFSLPTTIGDNVLFSSNVTVLDGTQIGDGSVIAASALVTGAIGEFGIYGGVPARKIKDRFTADALAAYRALNLPLLRAHCLPLLPRVMRAIEAGESVADATRQLERMKRVPKIVLNAEITANRRVKVTGVKDYFIGEERITHEGTRDQLGRYFAQPFSGNPIFSWTPDIFYTLGIE